MYQHLFCIERLCKISSSNVVNIFYYLNFESRLRYGMIFGRNSSMSNRVFVLQKRAISCMFGLKHRESCKSAFIEKSILTLPSLYILEILTFVKKNLTHFNFQNAFRNYLTRYSLDLQYNIHRLELYNANPYYMGIALYNKLENRIKNMPSIEKFISVIKQVLLKKAL